eukprot:5532867-Prymnesium_polylepis.2
MARGDPKTRTKGAAFRHSMRKLQWTKWVKVQALPYPSTRTLTMTGSPNPQRHSMRKLQWPKWVRCPNRLPVTFPPAFVRQPEQGCLITQPNHPL